ncbi:hypothetical protein ATCV1_z456L [Acanthocystis turfacea chlorella virus 1]|uniref:Uncharacterized protein z456L n=1 Tax=Chlorovirus heliozoae TaxID=322019 RepID=A7K966_9PHYC|nr:hypothetical protein ATCV1_z456L [Acanthocystis turfacea chlorella virus 1]ABT16590.1 hypothetical protein ATCV1_z456L [Acanthocystis turfacea chlorella virus 1]
MRFGFFSFEFMLSPISSGRRYVFPSFALAILAAESFFLFANILEFFEFASPYVPTFIRFFAVHAFM